jgi:hypothetical protein
MTTSKGSVASRRLGSWPAMTPKTLRVRRLTLAPTSSLAQEGDRPVEDEAVKILDREWMARAVAITVATSTCHW